MFEAFVINIFCNYYKTTNTVCEQIVIFNHLDHPTVKILYFQLFF